MGVETVYQARSGRLWTGGVKTCIDCTAGSCLGRKAGREKGKKKGKDFNLCRRASVSENPDCYAFICFPQS